LLHEIPDQQQFFAEIQQALKPDGLILIAEPPFRVSRRAFEETIDKARNAGLTPVERPKIFLSKAVVLKNEARI
jgi:hypothetical protein